MKYSTRIIKLGIVFCLIIPFLISVKSITNDSMAFWYDPARDFLLALDNLKKITLIGPPTGIPGVFYGPYWIWLISIPLLVSRDPRLVSLTFAVPYLILFPYLLYRLRNILGLWPVLWLLFYNSFSSYINSLWNPHLAPFFILLLINLIVQINNRKNLWRNLFLAGICSGLIINFQFSLGLGILSGTILFLLFTARSRIIFFITGVLIAFMPFIIFESRHGFNQVQALYKVITDSLFYNSAAVGVVGLSKPQILSMFLNHFNKLIQIPLPQVLAIILLLILAVLSVLTTKLGIFIVLNVLSILTLYLTSKNPVWEYHFIGMEVFFLMLTGMLAKKIKYVKYLLIGWIVFLTLVNIRNEFLGRNLDLTSLPTLYTKKYIVRTVYQDAQGKPFSIFIYSPAIYTYDYDYIIKWFGKSEYDYLPTTSSANNLTYLIIPKTETAVKEDFINYRTPSDNFQTERIWEINDGTTIVKRVKLVNNK